MINLNKPIWAIIFGAILLTICSCESKLTAQNQLLGSWNLIEVRWISADTTHVLKKHQLGMLLVTADRYSIMWSPTKDKRIPFNELSNPTDEEIKHGFRSIVFNAGSYHSTDSTMTTTSILAKVPGFEGGKQQYTYRATNNKLTLIMYDETYPNGKKPNWSGIWKTKFLFEKTIRK